MPRSGLPTVCMPRTRAALLTAALLAAPGCVTPEMRGPLDYGRAGWLLYGDEDSPVQKERNRKAITEFWGNPSPAPPAQSNHSDNP